MIDTIPEYKANTESEPIFYVNTSVNETPLYSNTIANSDVYISTVIDSSEPIQNLNANTNSISTPIGYTTPIEETPININSESNILTPIVTTEVQNEPIYATTTIQEQQENENPVIVRPTIVRTEITQSSENNINTTSPLSATFNPSIFINTVPEPQLYTTSVTEPSFYSQSIPIPDGVGTISTSSPLEEIKGSIPIQQNLTFLSDRNNYNNISENIEPINSRAQIQLPSQTLSPMIFENSRVLVPIQLVQAIRSSSPKNNQIINSSGSNNLILTYGRSSLNNNQFNSSNEMPIPGCNCPKCTNLRKYNNQEKSIPKPIIPIRVMSPISSNNNLFNSSNEMPLPGCNCPKCINLRRYNNQVKPILKTIYKPPTPIKRVKPLRIMRLLS